VVWTRTETNWGVTEGGSSGSPIFNDQGLIVGQLTGGEASCSNLTGPDYYGKFSHSWDQIGDTDSTQLKPWLDPDNTGMEVLGGLVSTVDLLKSDVNFKLYPNPSQGHVFIEFDEKANGNIHSIQLLDIKGRVIKNNVEHPSHEYPEVIELNLNPLEAGIYFVAIRTESGKTFSQKLIR
jgi:hypothetical protein